METYTVEIVLPEHLDVDGSGETRKVAVREDEYILAAARASGVWLPGDCQQGWCTMCAARLLEGKVETSAARRLYDVDEETNLFLPCTAKPRSDCRMVAGQYEAMLDHRADHDLPPGRSKR